MPTQEILKPLSVEDCADVLSWVQEDPQPREWLIEGYIPAWSTGLLLADGGVGKSNLSNLLCYVIATGQTIGPFHPPKANRVLQINAEDARGDIALRINALANIYRPKAKDFSLIKKNWLIFPAKQSVGTLMELKAGQAVPTPYLKWLEHSIKDLQPSLLILDTKARLYGLDENSNTHNSLWIRELDKISEKYKCGMLILHHTKKMPPKATESEILSAAAGRGGSSTSDDARYVISAAEISHKDSQKFGLWPNYDYFKIQASKMNYGRKKPPVYFHKQNEGIPVHISPSNRKAEKISEHLLTWLKGMTEKEVKVTKRDLMRADTPETRELKDQISKNFYGKTNKGINSDMEISLNLLIADGRVVVGENGRGNSLGLK